MSNTKTVKICKFLLEEISNIVGVYYLGGDVEQVVEHHLGGLHRAPALPAATGARHVTRAVLPTYNVIESVLYIVDL